MSKFLFSFCIYSIEYKKNQHLDQLELLSTLSSYDRIARKLWEAKGAADKKEKSADDLFIDRIENSYLKNSSISYIYYNWIVPLIHSGIFQKKETIKNAKEIQDICIKQKIEPAYIKLSKIRQIMQVENSEVDKAIKDVIEAVTNGSYTLSEYPEIFYTIESVLKFSSFAEENFVDNFKKGINISKQHSFYFYNLKTYYRFDKKISPQLQSVIEYTYQQNENIKDVNDSEVALKVIQAINPYNKENFLKAFSGDNIQRDIFHLIKPETFYEAFIKLSNENKYDFYKTFNKISNDYLNSASHKKDLIFFNSLKELFDSTKETSISQQHCIWMSDRLKEIIDRIDST